MPSPGTLEVSFSGAVGARRAQVAAEEQQAAFREEARRENLRHHRVVATGENALTLHLYFPSSWARVRVKPAIPALAAE